MPRVMFTITYSVRPEHRDAYLELARQMKYHFTTVGKKDYSVFEAKGKRNQFTEVFISKSIEEYDALEDNQDETTQALVAKLEELIDDVGMKYATTVEVI
jgi:hypothetical protein